MDVEIEREVEVLSDECPQMVFELKVRHTSKITEFFATYEKVWASRSVPVTLEVSPKGLTFVADTGGGPRLSLELKF